VGVDNRPAGFGFCNPAYNDGGGKMTTAEYIETCPEEWQPALKSMARIADLMFEGAWGITQVKTKFGQARIYLWAEDPQGHEREALSDLEAFTEIAIDAVLARLEDGD
jgi:hypothetical protein